jgi:hypothetical protein
MSLQRRSIRDVSVRIVNEKDQIIAVSVIPVSLNVIIEFLYD